MSAWPGALSFGDVWADTVAANPDRLFLRFEAPSGIVRDWTYGEFDTLVARMAAQLVRNGVVPGSSVHLALTNSPAFVAAWIATARLGAWLVPSDPSGRTPELAGHIERTRPAVGLYAAARSSDYLPAAAGMATIAFDEADTELDQLGNVTFGDWPQLALRDRAAVMFTSGTTGRPKGVEVTQANYAFAGKVMAEAACLQAHHRQLVVLPMFHANAQYYSFASAIWAGASVALMHTFSASKFLTQAAQHEATHASLFAAPIRMILARGADPVDGVRLQHCWYAMNISDDQYQVLGGLLGCRPRQLYGMTETIPAVLTDESANPLPASMGYVTPGCVVDVHDAGGSSTAPGEVGEIVVGGEPGITLFAGYLDDPQTTAASFAGEWFRTGDRARRDSSGRHFFDGRRADVLKVAGENVSIVEVEHVLAAHPAVLEVAVVGMPDPVRDEVPVAYVVAADPARPPTIEELFDWCNERLAKSKRPRDISFVSELPRTSVGKIRKFLLKDPNAETKPESQVSERGAT
ncbi:MAG TPA: AMP-binding protein [Ilumatobacteraceae bacterium]|nr:AMP-binding protein [Ilumatobacteraceae bacterium]